MVPVNGHLFRYSAGNARRRVTLRKQTAVLDPEGDGVTVNGGSGHAAYKSAFRVKVRLHPGCNESFFLFVMVIELNTDELREDLAHR